MSVIPAGRYVVDASHSEVGFSVRHAGVAKVRGSFTEFSGEVNVAEDFSQSTASATIAAGSVHTGNADRDGHLTSPDFWDAANNPEWTFTTKEVRGAGEEFQLVGDLTLNGITKEAVLDVEYNGTAKGPDGVDRVGFSAQTAISRKDFDLTWNVALEGGGLLVGDKVTIALELAGVRENS